MLLEGEEKSVVGGADQAMFVCNHREVEHCLLDSLQQVGQLVRGPTRG